MDTINLRSPEHARRVFQAVFRGYMGLTSKSGADALRAKANDFRIQVYRQLRAQAWGGRSRPGTKVVRRSLPYQELQARAKHGKGIKIRRGVGDGAKIPKKDRLRRRIDDYRSSVARELYARSRGIGVLATSFLAKRWRPNKGKGKLVSNQTGYSGRKTWLKTSNRYGHVLLGIHASDKRVITFSDTPGIDKVINRYGIEQSAYQAVIADMQTYLDRRGSAIYRNLVREIREVS